MNEERGSNAQLAGRDTDERAFRAGPVSGTLGGAMLLQSVTAEAYPGFDRIVFGCAPLRSLAGRASTYAVSADAPPFSSHGSGDPLAIDGRAFLRVDFLEVYAHDPERPRQAVSPSLVLYPGLGVVAEICRSDDTGGYVELVIGLSRGAQWRVSELADPPRLIVDIENRITIARVGAA